MQEVVPVERASEVELLEPGCVKAGEQHLVYYQHVHRLLSLELFNVGPPLRLVAFVV